MKQKDILLLLIPAFILVLSWIVFNIYHNTATSTITEVVSSDILPIKPNFDTKTIEEIKKRKKSAPIYELSLPSPIPSPSINIASSEGELKL